MSVVIPDVTKYKLSELKEELAIKGLKTTGNKSELVLRLHHYYSSVDTKEDFKMETQDADAILPGDSVSQAGSRASTTSSARACAAARKAALKAELMQFDEEQRLRADVAEKESQLRRHQLQTKLVAAEAEENVLAEHANSVTGPSLPPLPDVRSKEKVNYFGPNQEERYASAAQPSQVLSSSFYNKSFVPQTSSVYELPPPLSTSFNRHSTRQSQPKSTAFHSNPTVTTPNIDPVERQLFDLLSLPKPELSTFDGDPMNFHFFMNTFNTCIHSTSISDATKLNRLFELCKGKALQVIKPCSLMDPSAGYIKARSLLAERFGNDFVIAETWISKITEGPPVKKNSKESLQEFSDDVRCCTETLRAMGRLDEVDSRVRLVKLVGRLPPYIQGRWRKQVIEQRDRSGTYL